VCGRALVRGFFKKPELFGEAINYDFVKTALVLLFFYLKTVFLEKYLALCFSRGARVGARE
jgi:hypothetical protein